MIASRLAKGVQRTTRAAEDRPQATPAPMGEVVPIGRSAETRGWLQSTIDLRDGLEVTEDVAIDDLPLELQRDFGRL